jgi:hypothetical protein
LFAGPDRAGADLFAAFPDLLESGQRAPLDPSGIWLVRPDGYVAMTARAGDWQAGSEYLQRIRH